MEKVKIQISKYALRLRNVALQLRLHVALPKDANLVSTIPWWNTTACNSVCRAFESVF